jgi:hypothetical protein
MTTAVVGFSFFNIKSPSFLSIQRLTQETQNWDSVALFVPEKLSSFSILYICRSGEKNLKYTKFDEPNIANNIASSLFHRPQLYL